MIKSILVAALAMLATFGGANASNQGAKLTPDKKYGACHGSEILSDFFKRFPPPKNSRFSLEIDISKKTNEIYVYYYELADYEGMTAFYSGETCEFLRTEQKNKASPKHV